ncbi:MAG: PAS domain S-box protein [Sedimentisphaerales bacterium]|nr:PAS domain S-box protein [Sedimentisphaerales bacterium]
MGTSSRPEANGSGENVSGAGQVPDSGVRKGPEASGASRTDHRSEDGLLAEFDRQFRTMFEATVDGIVVADNETRRVYTGKGLNVIAPTEVQGQQRWYNTTIEPIRDAAGRITAALVIGRDIHELQQARQALDEYREKMCRAEQLASLGALSATIARELTQPLTVSRLALQEAMTELDAAGRIEKVMESLRECLEGVCDAASRVERFRSFTRRSPREAPGEVRLQDVVKQTVRLLEGRARQRRVSLSTRGMTALPPIYANEKDVQQMCFALMEDAIQAADGNRARKLDISGRKVADGVMLQFEDTRGGMAPEHVDRIFEPFFTTRRQGEGAGLGLSTVRRVVTQANGSIRVENRPGEGATFRVTLPVRQQA